MTEAFCMAETEWLCWPCYKAKCPENTFEKKSGKQVWGLSFQFPCLLEINIWNYSSCCWNFANWRNNLTNKGNLECLWFSANVISGNASVVAIVVNFTPYHSHTISQGRWWVHQWHINWRGPFRRAPHKMLWKCSNQSWGKQYSWFCFEKRRRQMEWYIAWRNGSWFSGSFKVDSKPTRR